MTIPTRKEYEQAKLNVEAMKKWVHLERKTIDELLDKLISSRRQIKMYEEAIKSRQQVIDTYEVYEEILKNT